MVDMKKLKCIADKHGIAIVEDAAHAIGTKYKGRKIGNFGNVTVFSFYATKNLTCGEGGMVVSKNKKIIEKIRKISYFGINKQAYKHYAEVGKWYYEIEELGYKYNMDNIHAAVGLSQLKRLDEMNQRRRFIAKMYKKALDKKVKFTEDTEYNYHTFHLFPIRIDKKIMERNDFINKLSERNIEAGVHFLPLHKHPYYKSILKGKVFPVSTKVYKEIVSLPMFASMSDEDVSYVIENINGILKERG